MYSKDFLLSFDKNYELFENFQPLKLQLSQNVLIFEERKKFLTRLGAPKGLKESKSSGVVGVDWESVRSEPGKIIMTIGLTRPLAEGVDISIPFFGYSSKIPFSDMPKFDLHLSALTYSVYDQYKLLDQGLIHLVRSGNQISIQCPLKTLGDPQKIFTCINTYVNDFHFDHTSWVVLELQQ